jgi:hypothetical protein
MFQSVRMNLSTFDSYSSDEQLQLIREQGTYLMTRKGRSGRIGLYHLGLFFGEVWYNSEGTCIKMVRGFSCLTFLEPYLKKIQVPDAPAVRSLPKEDS